MIWCRCVLAGNYSEELSEAFAFEEQNEKYLLYRNVHNEVSAEHTLRA